MGVVVVVGGTVVVVVAEAVGVTSTGEKGDSQGRVGIRAGENFQKQNVRSMQTNKVGAHDTCVGIVLLSYS